jgi:hypothetical protein
LNIQGILLGFKIGGNYYLACGFPIAPKHMIGEIVRYFYTQGPCKTHPISNLE